MPVEVVPLGDQIVPAVNNAPDPCCDVSEEGGSPFKQSPDLITVEGLFVSVARSLYSCKDNLQYCCKTWFDNKDKDSLFIDLSNNPRVDKVERHPAIYVEVTNLTSTTDQLNGIGSAAGFDPVTGASCHNGKVMGKVVFNHIARSAGEAKSYGSNSFNLLRGHSYAIKKMLCFEKLDVASIVKPSLREDVSGEWNCPVTMAFEYVDSWELIPDAPLLKQIELNITDFCTNIVKNDTLVK